MPHHTVLDRMSKNELVKAIQTYGCGKLRLIPFEVMTKEQIVEHLQNCDCPVIQKYLKQKVK